MGLELTGTLLHIGQKQEFGKFVKRDFVVSTSDGRYHQHIKLELFGGQEDMILSYSIGQEVKVDFNLRGKFGKDGKCYNTLQAWKVAPFTAQGSDLGYDGHGNSAELFEDQRGSDLPQSPVSPPESISGADDLPF